VSVPTLEDISDVARRNEEKIANAYAEDGNNNDMQYLSASPTQRGDPFDCNYVSAFLYPDTKKHRASPRDYAWSWLHVMSVARLTKSGLLAAFRIPQIVKKQTLIA
jgi:hypothetical protein